MSQIQSSYLSSQISAHPTAHATQETPLQNQHHYFSTHQKEWRALETVKRTELIKQFYEADLPAISLYEAPIHYHHFDRDHVFFANLDKYSSAQLSWYREILDNEDIDSNDFENYFSFMERCQQTGIEMFRWDLQVKQEMSMEPSQKRAKYDPSLLSLMQPELELAGEKAPQSIQDFLQGNPRYVDMLYNEFQKNPIYRIYCECVKSGYQGVNFEKLFAGRPPLPTIEHIMQQLDTAQVETMDPSLLQMWHRVLKTQDFEQLKTLSESVQKAFVLRFTEYNLLPIKLPSPGNLNWINALSQYEIDNLSENQCLWYGALFRTHPNVLPSFQVAYAINASNDTPLKVPYLLTHEVVEQAQNDEMLREDLKAQVLNGNIDGFSSLPEEDQEKLRNLLGVYGWCLDKIIIRHDSLKRAREDQ